MADPRTVAQAQLPEQAASPLPADTAAVLDKAAAEAFGKVSATGAVVAVQTPAGTWAKAYGTTDLAARTPMTTAVYQRIGSVTKTFNGTLVLQLAEEGRLDLDDPIDRYVPGVPNGKAVTLRMLMDMTSGVASYTVDRAFQDQAFASPGKVWTPDQLLAIGLALPPLFEPGTQFNYSNTNAVLLGKVVEKVAGKPFAAVLEERILAPLGLQETSMPSATDTLPDPHATGYTLQGTPADVTTPVDTSGWNPSWAWTAGEMVSTAEDLLVYGRALGTGQGLLDEETQIERLSIPGKRGYGLAVDCVDGWFGHIGELPGYNTTLYYDTTSDTTVVVLANSDIPSGACTDSKTLPDNPTDEACMDPATRLFAGVSTALGHAFTPNPQS